MANQWVGRFRMTDWCTAPPMPAKVRQINSVWSGGGWWCFMGRKRERSAVTQRFGHSAVSGHSDQIQSWKTNASKPQACTTSLPSLIKFEAKLKLNVIPAKLIGAWFDLSLLPIIMHLDFDVYGVYVDVNTHHRITTIPARFLQNPRSLWA